MQGELFKTRGGKRKRAGRKPKGARAGVSHARREEVRAYWPVHVTLRVVRDAPYLRKRKIWRAIAKATSAAKQIRIVQASVQHDHVHLLVETSDRFALAKGMHAFQISAAYWINRAADRHGRVFADRYHTHVLKTLREARNATGYVLSNWRKHGEDGNARHAIDFYSTGYAFWGATPPSGYEALAIEPARTWLLRNVGEISPWGVPG